MGTHVYIFKLYESIGIDCKPPENLVEFLRTTGTLLLAIEICFHILQRCVCVAGRRVKGKRGTDGAGEEVRPCWHPVQCLVRTVCSPLVYLQSYFAIDQDHSSVFREKDVFLAVNLVAKPC